MGEENLIEIKNSKGVFVREQISLFEAIEMFEEFWKSIFKEKLRIVGSLFVWENM